MELPCRRARPGYPQYEDPKEPEGGALSLTTPKLIVISGWGRGGAGW